MTIAQKTLPPHLAHRSAFALSPVEDDEVAIALGLPRQNWHFLMEEQARFEADAMKMRRRAEDIERAEAEAAKRK